MTTVMINEVPLAIEDLLAVVDGARVELDDGARARIAASRAVVDRALTGGEAVYGLTTQVGHGKDTRLSEEEVRGEQRFLVMSHSGGIGPPLPTAIVRAALAVRLNGIARGGSGAGVAVAEILAALLNAGVHPVVPETASVGAADVGQMAGMAQRAARVAEAADVAAALSMEATGANTSVLHPAVGRAKPIPGQVAAADHLRVLLAGSPLLGPGGARSVQDALSFRVVPQVHGALREYVTAARGAVTAELNAAADNPLVSVPDQALVSNGNFHPMVLAIACDALRIALAQAGQLSERRMTHLWAAFFQQLTSGPPPAVAYGLQLRYPAAALFPELKQLAAPASLDTPPLDLGVEDHGTGAPLSVRKTDAALSLLEDLLAIELLLARDLLAAVPARRVLGAGTGAALRTVEQAIAAADPYPDAVHRALRDRFPTHPAPGNRETPPH